MGCVENRKQIRITKNLTNKKSLIFLKYRNSISLKDKFSTVCNSEEGINKIFINKSDKITNQLWLNILDYLNYKELKETGKVNRFFNKTSKQKELLIKFFQKKDTDHNNFSKVFYEEKNPIINTILSFSILRNQNYFDDEYSDLSIINRENQ